MFDHDWTPLCFALTKIRGYPLNKTYKKLRICSQVEMYFTVLVLYASKNNTVSFSNIVIYDLNENTNEISSTILFIMQQV